MTIDEAIAHARAVAKHKRKKLDECNNKNNYACKFCIEIRTCKEVAEEHEQLAEWLEELKKYKEKPEGWMWDEAEMKGYNKAIDDFVNRLSEYLCIENATKYGNKNAEQQRNLYDPLFKYQIADAIDDVAQKLKEGERE